MIVKEFLKKYEKNKDISKHITKKYLPYAEKITLCNRIIDATCYTKISDDKKIFKIDTPSRQMLLMLSIIDKYTDIDINWEDALADFDALSESELLGEILKVIPENEVTLCSSLLDMCLDDLMTNTRDLLSWVESKVEASNMVINTILETVMNTDELKPIINSLGIGEILSK